MATTTFWPTGLTTDVRQGASGTSRDVPIFVQFYKRNQKYQNLYTLVVKNPKFVHFGCRWRSAVTNCRTSLHGDKHYDDYITLTALGPGRIIDRARSRRSSFPRSRLNGFRSPLFTIFIATRQPGILQSLSRFYYIYDKAMRFTMHLRYSDAINDTFAVEL